MLQTKGNQDNQISLPLQDDHLARQDKSNQQKDSEQDKDEKALQRAAGHKAKQITNST